MHKLLTRVKTQSWLLNKVSKGNHRIGGQMKMSMKKKERKEMEEAGSRCRGGR